MDRNVENILEVINARRWLERKRTKLGTFDRR